MDIGEAIKNRESCLAYLEGCGPTATPECVEAVRWSLRALRLCGAVFDRSLWNEDCPSCQLVAYHPEYLQEHPEMCYQYCPDCGKPRTERARAEWERKVQRYAEERTL